MTCDGFQKNPNHPSPQPKYPPRARSQTRRPAPLDLLNQITDHRHAITLTEQAIAGDLSPTDWRNALKPLLVDMRERTGEAAVTININIHEAAEPSPGPPNTRFWRWVVSAVIVVTLVAGLMAIVSDSFNIQDRLAVATSTATQTATATGTPTVTPMPSAAATALPFATASISETLIVIASFHETTPTKTEPHFKIKRAIEAVAEEVELETLRVEVEPTVLRADEREAVEALGERYNASIIIWGEDTGVQVLVNFLNLKQPDFAAAEVEIDERERTQIVNPDAYAAFILSDLPGQLTFLSFFAVGQSFLVTEQYAQAKDTIERGIGALSDEAKPEGVAEAYFRLGWLYSVPLKDLKKAIANYDQSIELNSEVAEPYNNRGFAYYEQGDLEAAIADYDRAIELNPEDALAYDNRGLAYAKQGDLTVAITDFDRAIQLNPEDAGIYYNRGNVYAEQGDLEAALADFDRAIELNPEVAEPYNNRGLAHYEQGDLKAAIADFDRAIGLNPENAKAYHNRGNAYAEQGDLEAAIADFNRAIDLNPEDAEVYYNRGNTYTALEEYDKALADYDKAIELDPEDALAYNNRGNTYATLEEYDKALADYDKAIEFDPEDGGIFYNRGNTYTALEEYDKALADFDKAIELEPDYALAFYNRGNTYATLEEYDKALADFDKAIELKPDYALAFHYRGFIYATLEDYDSVIADFRKAAELDPENTDLLAGLCWDGSLPGFALEIIEICDQAVTLAPEAGYVRGSRGLARTLTGDTSGAIEDFEFAAKWWKENDPSAPWSDLQSQWIKILESGGNPFDEVTLEKLRNGEY